MSIADELMKIPQYTRNKRHLWSVLQHGTPTKLVNLALAEVERKLRRVQIRSRPYLLIIDPCNFCNLRCPLCPTGLNDLGRPQAMMTFEQFKSYIDPHLPYLFEAYLHNWGESLINKEIFKMIEYVQSRNVGTNLSSNFVLVTDNDIDNILHSGLEYLVISLDGTSQDSYSQYRVRGDYDRVVDNLANLIARKKHLKLKTPVIEWQFIVMKQNEHQIADAELLSKQLGVDIMRFIPVGMPFEFKNRQETANKWFPITTRGRLESHMDENQTLRPKKDGPCFYLYRSTVINPDGGVSPCCEVYRSNHDFASMTEGQSDFSAIWNNENYLSARSQFVRHPKQGQKTTVCDGCNIFTKPIR